MARKWGHEIVEISSIIIIIIFLGLVLMLTVRHVPLNSRIVDWDILVVFVGPTIIDAALILTKLFASASIDTEANVADKDLTAIVILARDIKYSGLFPLVEVVDI